MNRAIIGLSGRKQCGKSTAADYLVGCGFVKHSFASPIKNMVTQLLNDLGYESRVNYLLNEGKEVVLPGLGKTPRWLLQTLGTEWGRDLIDPDLWIEVAHNKIFETRSSVVFDDVRFENEADLIRRLGGVIIHIDRGALVTDSHVSEAGIVAHDSDLFIDNDHTISDFLIDVNLTVAGFIGS